MQSRAVYCAAEVPNPMEQTLAHFLPEPEPEATCHRAVKINLLAPSLEMNKPTFWAVRNRGDGAFPNGHFTPSTRVRTQ
jgi:hypothetical protein